MMSPYQRPRRIFSAVDTMATDRDDRVLAGAHARAAGRAALVPPAAARFGCESFGSGTEISIGYAREDGARVPLGYARYVAAGVDPGDYDYFRFHGLLVAAPRNRSGEVAAALAAAGPAGAGYVRVGDALVPAFLGPGDRATLASHAA